MPGRATITTPSIPAAVAAQRRTPTTSPRIGIDSTVISNGEMKLIVLACAICMLLTPNTNKTADPTTHSPRTTCNVGLRGHSARGSAERTSQPANAHEDHVPDARDLDHRHACGEVLRRGIGCGKHRGRDHRQSDAAQRIVGLRHQAVIRRVSSAAVLSIG